MAGTNEKATFSIKLEDQVSSEADRAADAVKNLQGRMTNSQKAITNMSKALKNLTGDTEEIKKAKEQLQKRIDAERNALSQSQLAVQKNAEGLRRLTERTKALKDLEEKKRKVDKEKLDRMKLERERASETKASFDGLNSTLLAGVGILAAAGVAIGAVTFKLLSFGLHAADAARSAALLREAATVGFAGGAANGGALGSQVDALARKVPTAKAALNDLAVSFAKGRLEGQTLVDALNATAQASAALGDDAGGKIRALTERGAVTKRFSIGDDRFSEDLSGTGLRRDDVAQALAKNLKIGVDKARIALAQGRVKLADGAAALRVAVESKFGEINQRKMLSLPNLFQKLEEKLNALVKDVNLEPLLKGLDDLFSFFDTNTVTGATLKQLVELIGSTLPGAIQGTTPTIKSFMKGMLIGALDLTISFLTLRNQLRDTFKDISGVVSFNDAMTYGKLALYGVAAGVVLVTGAFAAMAATVALPIAAWLWLQRTMMDFGKSLREADWSNAGRDLVLGLVKGLLGGGPLLMGSIAGLAGDALKTFKEKLGIHSPSTVFAALGENTVEGYTRGVEGAAPRPADALDAMVSSPSGGGRGGAGAVSISMPITIQVSGQDAAKQLTDPNFLAQLSKALEQVLVSAGVPATSS